LDERDKKLQNDINYQIEKEVKCKVPAHRLSIIQASRRCAREAEVKDSGGHHGQQPGPARAVRKEAAAAGADREGEQGDRGHEVRGQGKNALQQGDDRGDPGVSRLINNDSRKCLPLSREQQQLLAEKSIIEQNLKNHEQNTQDLRKEMQDLSNKLEETRQQRAETAHEIEKLKLLKLKQEQAWDDTIKS